MENRFKGIMPWRKKLIEIILVTWILIIMFFWWILNELPGFKYKFVRKMPYYSDIRSVLKTTQKKVRPYIYRPYIWDVNSKKKEK